MKEKKDNIYLKLKSLPHESGVYLMKNSEEKIIYVGKAIDLAKRVRSYFNKNNKDQKTTALVDKIVNIEWIVTHSELEALMLETNLIKKYRPKYNILMKDDKNYVYIKIAKEDFPRVYVVRKVLKDGAKYFGPYTDALSIKETLRILNRIFPFYTYKNKSGVAPMNSQAGKELFYKRTKSAWGDLSDKNVYSLMLQDFLNFLRGRKAKVVNFLRNEMYLASENKMYEKAGLIRDRLQDIERITARQKVITPGNENLDVLEVFIEEKEAAGCVLVIREGKLLDVKKIWMKNVDDLNKNELVQNLLVEYYNLATDIPSEIIIGEDLYQMDLLVKFLHNKKGSNVKLRYAQKGEKRKLLELASKNAEMFLKKKKIEQLTARNEAVGLVQLFKELKICGGDDYDLWKRIFAAPKSLLRIEAYDISHFGESGVVGAMVVWELKDTKKKGLKFQEDILKWKGQFNNKNYRRFKIKSFAGQNDFAALGEVLGRRFLHKEEGWQWPDLILIDGGKGQLGSVWTELKSRGIDIPIISLAKREEEIWMINVDDMGEVNFVNLLLDKDSPASLLLQNIRDEVHRFVIGYQRNTRRKDIVKSKLDQVEGLGPTKKKMLLKEFGSLKGVYEAGQEKVGEIVGNSLAKRIFEMVDDE